MLSLIKRACKGLHYTTTLRTLSLFSPGTTIASVKILYDVSIHSLNKLYDYSQWQIQSLYVHVFGSFCPLPQAVILIAGELWYVAD